MRALVTGGAGFIGSNLVDALYGQAKLSAKGYLRLYGDLHGLQATALRFANVYGPRQDPLGEGGVIAIFCGLAVDGGDALVFGDGEQTRDVVYVGDVVDALLAAGDRGAGFEPFNVGTGEETTVNALAERLGLGTRREPPRPGEVQRSCLDPSRAAGELGWTPATSLAAGLEKTLAWARDRA